MNHEFLSEYEKLCLKATISEIRRAYPRLRIQQIEQDKKLMVAIDSEWERAKFRRWLNRVKKIIYRF